MYLLLILIDMFMRGFKMFIESSEEDYRGSHRAPGKGEGAPLHDLTQVYPDDIYTLPLPTAARYYGHGEPLDMEALSIMQRAKGRPMMPVKVYRAVPDLNKVIDKKIKEYGRLIWYVDKYGFPPIADESARDLWAELGRNKEVFNKRLYDEIANLQSERVKPISLNVGDWVTPVRGYAVDHGRSVLRGDYKIVSKTVKAKDLYTDGNSPYEFGYDP
jgi:hypothetical protein